MYLNGCYDACLGNFRLDVLHAQFGMLLAAFDFEPEGVFVQFRDGQVVPDVKQLVRRHRVVR
jgi:hypothetical protein